VRVDDQFLKAKFHRGRSGPEQVIIVNRMGETILRFTAPTKKEALNKGYAFITAALDDLQHPAPTESP
jgi:hypothetical protein